MKDDVAGAVIKSNAMVVLRQAHLENFLDCSKNFCSLLGMVQCAPTFKYVLGEHFLTVEGA